MSYRFLPWARQGLAGRIEDADGLGPSLPARASFPVRVTLSTGDAAAVDLRLNGPGDVIGVDPRAIVRTEPPRFARNASPEQFAAIEFDEPAFPWMFTPAAAGSDERLRPWCALVVVAEQDGVRIEVDRDRPLPRLVIEPPAVPSMELPDLAESWAWAHTQIVEDGPPASVPDHLRDHPDQNVARIMCPRRLEPDRDYLACLVPAFEIGRLAGLGQPVPDDPTTTAAWGASGGVGASIVLPLYFHWEFRTGPSGDFESLSRRLTPRPVPDTVGQRRMFVGSAHPALPAVAHDAGGILMIEGALRAPEAGDGDSLGPEHDDFVAALNEVLNAPADHAVDGASVDAESVAPPLYGGAHVGVERLDGSEHRWLGELNRDPRHRAAAGVGTEVVRQNQERFMDAAWQQVGDVLSANERLDRARLLKEAMGRIHRRHIAPMRPDVLLGVTAPVHARVAGDARSMERIVEMSTLPSGATAPGFRRMTSPRAPALRRAERLAGRTGAAGRVEVVTELARGDRPLDLLAKVPDGLVGTALLDRFDGRPGAEVGGELGAPATVPGAMVRSLRDGVREVVATPPPETLQLRPDIAVTGIIIRSPLLGVDMVGARPGLGGTIRAVLDAPRGGRGNVDMKVRIRSSGAVDVEVARGDDSEGRRLPPVRPVRPADRVPLSGPAPPRGARRPGPGAPLGPGRPIGPGRPGRPVVPRPPIGPAGPGLPGPVGPTIPIGPGGEPVLHPPVTDPEVVSRFDAAFQAHRAAVEITVESTVPPPAPLDLAMAKGSLVAAVDPAPVIDARARLAVSVGGRPLVDGVLGPRVRQQEPLDPIMIAPELGEPLYAALADHDPDRFLPGIGEIPDDTVTMLETNPRFVEAFLIGANHEMNRELLWRRYPTDRRGTVFPRFWDRVDGAADIAPIHAIGAARRLGTSTGADLRGSLVLLVRGQLLRRFPGAVVYATPSLADGTLDTTPSAARNPVFWGRLDPDVTFVGFDLTREDVEPAPGWFFVIAEQPAEPRFGLDAPGGGPPPSLATWSDLEWGHADVPAGGHLGLAASGLMGIERPVVAGGARATMGRNAAHVAAITFQRPFRAAIHSSEIIEGAAGPGEPARPVYAHSVLFRPLSIEGGG